MKLALEHRAHYFQHILAVTFTNKSTQEMKDRILEYLDAFARGLPNELAGELRRELALDDALFRERSREVQREILHHYSQFSISTIDAFFQKVIRSFTRESSLTGDYRLEVELNFVLEEVIDQLIDELGTNRELTRWVVEFATENLESDKPWDVRRNLREFAGQIFKEEFKEIENEILNENRGYAFFNELRKLLSKARFAFIHHIANKAGEALEIMKSHHLQAEDFKYGGGIYNFFSKASAITSVSDFNEKAKGKRSASEFLNVNNWPDKDTRNRNVIIQLAQERLLPILEDINAYWSAHFRSSLSAELVLNNFYSFGLISDISRKLRSYLKENNLMLLADASKFLNTVIQESDTPFIYEKVGSFYRNFLIDEFQDTSHYQWKNFFPLVTNGLDQGYRSMVVGDVKQAIYRWRGGDLALLQDEIEEHVGRHRTKITDLDTNYRSAPAIIDFNNALFAKASDLVGSETGHDLPGRTFNESHQKAFKTNSAGFVQVQFIEEEEEKWNEVSLAMIPGHLEQLQQMKVPLSDIAILVRRRDEGHQIAAYLLQYRNSENAKPGCRYDVVSEESLRLDGAASVNLLLGAMRYLENGGDAVARAQLAYEFARLKEPGKPLTEVFTVANQVIFENNLPEAFTRAKAALKKLPLFELTETLISIFGIGDLAGEIPYLLAFQDVVLEFYSRERNDLGAFLEWWEENKSEKSIKVPGEVDAIQIMTIHKAKGLQFKFVLVPFCSWSMDQESWNAATLWVRSDEAMLKDAGWLPVLYSSRLKESCFKDDYAKEFVRVWLDNLNLLYVAFTRAEQGLIVTAPVTGGKTVAKLLHDSLVQDVTLEKSWVEHGVLWKTGELKPDHSKGAERPPVVNLLRYPASRWRDKLVIRKSSGSYFESNDEEVLEKIRYGIHLHAVLSRIKYADEMAQALDAIVKEGLITEPEKQPLAGQLGQLLAQEQIAGWFDRAWNVRTEVPILLPGGEENRIDRLMTKDGKAIVVDFKTGAHTGRDQQQVLDYMNILRQMGFREVDGFLLYLSNREVVNVTERKIRSLRQTKDKDQLSLEL